MNTYEENTGLESRLKYAVNDLKLKNEKLKSEVDELEHAYNNMKQYADRLLDENVEVGERNEELKTNMALMTDEIAELEKAHKDERHETQVYKKAWREQHELVALRDDQIAMLERKLIKREEDKN